MRGVLGAILRWASTSAQRIQIRDDVAQHAVGRVREWRHGHAGLDGLRIGNPSQHVLGRVGQPSRDDRLPADSPERWSDVAVGAHHAVDAMTRAASQRADCYAPARDGVPRRTSAGGTAFRTGREQREYHQDCSALVRSPAFEWHRFLPVRSRYLSADQPVAILSPDASTTRRFLGGWSLVTLVAFAAACGSSDRRATDVSVPDPERGRELANTTGCGTCHVIQGVHDANGSIGPPLTGIAQRSYIAGVLPNSPQNLAAWIRSPQSVKPGNAMPDLGLSQREAEDIAAFLTSRW